MQEKSIIKNDIDPFGEEIWEPKLEKSMDFGCFFPISIRPAARLISNELIVVKPVDSPKFIGLIDFKYVGVEQEKQITSEDIK